MVYCGSHPGLNVFVVIVTIFAAITICIGPYIGLQEWNETLQNNRSIFDASISASLLHATSLLPEILLIIGGLCLFFISIVRQIQLRVILDRNSQYKCCMRLWNSLNALILIISSVSLIVASIYKDGFIHVISAIISIGTSLFWTLSHAILTFIERRQCSAEYPTCFTRYIDAFLYLFIFILSVICWILFVIMYPQDEGYSPVTLNDNIENILGIARNDRYILEWIGFWLLYGIQHCVLIFTFIRNVVDDEIIQFFSVFTCCCRCNCSCNCCARSNSNNNGNGNNKTKEQMELYSVYT